MTDAGERTDEDLARAAKRGDSEAFDLLVRRFLRPAMALAFQYAGRIEDAEDVVQEAFHRAVRSLGNYDHRRSFSAWFYTIVRNVARSAINKKDRRATLAPVTPLEDEPPAPVTTDPAMLDDVQKAINALTRMQQSCVRLCDIEGFTRVEAALMLGIGEGTVRTHLHRARKQLRAAMRPERGGAQ